ncbi:MAG: Hpt domain-containing protein [Actinomycetota bacterium]
MDFLQSDEGFLIQVEAVFRKESLDRLARMSHLLEQAARPPLGDGAGSLEELHRLAHGMKGSASMIGWDDIARCAKGLEDLFRAVLDGNTTLGLTSTEIAQDAVRALSERISDDPSNDVTSGDLLLIAQRLRLAVRPGRLG